MSADVVVGTPNVLSPSYDEIAQPPADLFDLVIFDEAHHTPAATYSVLIDAFQTSQSCCSLRPPSGGIAILCRERRRTSTDWRRRSKRRS
ncbi:DEAD/DEAH box helicase family protein [Kribbella hippodromi]|uniref:DEAD/DEAH box helicase family protein n=1 Tax=Kribbella hippodromi TaxID=434347 RepID=UPI003CD0AE08